MELNEYQNKAMSTCLQSCNNFAYMGFGLMGEVGELAGKVAKAIRKQKSIIENNAFITERGSNHMTEQEIHDLKSEIGDCAWFIAGLCSVMGWELEEIAKENLAKLASRQQRNVIVGDGDNR